MLPRWCPCLLVFLVLLVAGVLAHSKYVKLIPNGDNIYIDGKHCKAIGHVTCSASGSGKHTIPFGDDFKHAGKKWTTSLCMMDSDGDGQTNGEELGDPCCVWKEGDQPARTTNLSHPGIASEMTTAEPCSHNVVNDDPENDPKENKGNDGHLFVGSCPLWAFVLAIGMGVLLVIYLMLSLAKIVKIAAGVWVRKQTAEIPYSSVGADCEDDHHANRMCL